MQELFTIGHSNHAIEHFIALLSTHGISAIADVRSSPYSQYSPQFNRELLERKLREAEIEYVFLGNELGARRDEESCYVDCQAKYDLIAQLPRFQAGLDRLQQGMEEYRVALTCSEAEPLACHRTILICRELRATQPNLRITHILGDGNVESHEEAEKRLIEEHGLQLELFGELSSPAGLLARAYELQGERIAYKRVPAEA